MVAFTFHGVFGRWQMQVTVSNETDETDDTCEDIETDSPDSASSLTVVSATLAADDRPHFGFTPSHPDQEPWWEDDDDGQVTR